jgi:predicted KAP-like P-loop ATPase
MWNDIETKQDLLNFSVISDTVAELIIESDGQPISVGGSGNWGTGKSSLVKMIGESLKENDSHQKKYVYLEFNAWLYQGYDDARAALIQAVSDKLAAEVKDNEAVLTKIKRFAKRINWLQLAKLALPLSLGLLPGGAAVGGIAAMAGVATNLLRDKGDKTSNSEEFVTGGDSLSPEIKEIIKESKNKSAATQIEDLRNEFKEILEALDVTLVVLVDDLDRCLPATAISTLEAMRLLLFVEHTAFIIAADEQMIRSSVKAHFANIEMSDGLVTSYFDKLIQIPLSVPRLGVAEVKVYLVSLFAELRKRKGEITEKEFSKALDGMQKLLKNAWVGNVSKADIEKVFAKQTVIMHESIDMAEQLAGILVTANEINGNPRLIKRFQNAISIREKVAHKNGLSVDYATLVKMLLFERCASKADFEGLVKLCDESEAGKLVFLKEIETATTKGEEPNFVNAPISKDKFCLEWLKLEPQLGDVDLRPYLYLSRNKSFIGVSYDELSKKGNEILEILTTKIDKNIINNVVKDIRVVGESEAETILRHLGRVWRNNQWERKTLIAALHITKAFPNLGGNLALLLKGIPAKSRKETYIPTLCQYDWAAELLIEWSSDTDTPPKVINAIKLKQGAT